MGLRLPNVIVLMGAVHIILSTSVDRLQVCPGREECQCACKYGKHDTIVAAECTNQNGSLRNIIECMPPSLRNLTVRVQHLEDAGANFTKFYNLTMLEFAWTLPPQELPRTRYSHSFSNALLFEGLSLLRILRINLPTTDMASDFLSPLDSLEVLDFSNMGYFTTSKLAKVFNDSRMQHKPLSTIILVRMSGANPNAPKQFELRKLFQFSKGHVIKNIDISFNGETYLYPGFLEYLPYCDTFVSKGMRVRFEAGNTLEVNCMIMELLLHQHLVKMDLSQSFTMGFGLFTSIFGSFANNYIRLWLKCLFHPHASKRQCLCKTHISMCGSLFPNNISCEHFPSDLNPLSWVDLGCEYGYKVPLPVNLQTLIVRNTQFSFVPQLRRAQTDCFGKNNLKELDFSFNKISFGGFSTIFKGFEHVHSLIIEYSNWGIFFVNPKFLHTWSGLETLNMAGTNIGVYIANDTSNEIFKWSQNLTKLILRDTTLSTIPTEAFKPLYNLEHLDLSKNRLDNISFDISSLKSLALFNITNNILANLSVDITDLLDANIREHNVSVDLSGNLLSCNCDSFDFLKWMNKTKVQFTNKHGYLCVHPDGLRSLVNVLQNLESLGRRCFPPPDYTLYIAVATTCFSSFMLGLLFLFIYRMRWKIRVCCLWLKYRNEFDDNQHYQYDAFVVYSDEDRFWVHHVMLNKLERECGLRLCVHHRDFVPGHVIEENIVTHMNDSRKTIIVISPSFFSSQWCQAEVQIARNRLFSEGKNVIVPVILLSYPKQMLTPTVKNILASTTYVEWSDDSYQQEYFWRKLDMPVRSKQRERSQCPQQVEYCPIEESCYPS